MTIKEITASLDDRIEESIAPTAHTTLWYKCDACENLHVVLRDEHKRIIATATLDVEMLTDMFRVIAPENKN